jgi:hypothetical protein
MLGSKRSRPLKKPQEIPHDMFFPRQKNIQTFKIKGTLVFLCPKEREREKSRARVKVNVGKGKGKRERERVQKHG